MHISNTLNQRNRDNYTFYIIDTTSGEFTKYYSGTLGDIISQIKADPENNMLARELEKQLVGRMSKSVDGILSFPYDGHVYSFIPN